jgi:hypothetical protein
LNRDAIDYRFVTGLAIRAKASNFKFLVRIHDLLIPLQSCLIFNHFDIIHLYKQK